MAKPKKLAIGGHAVEKDESEVRWLISYSDFMMQLVCLFILLYSVSSLDKGKMALVAAYYRASIGLGEPPVHEPPSKGPNLSVGDRPLVGGRQGQGDLPRDATFRVQEVPGGWAVTFEEPLFEPGSWALSDRATRALESLGKRFQPYAGMMYVTGYAGGVSGDAQGEAALKLAQARGMAAAAVLTREGGPGTLDPRFLEVAGRETHDETQSRRLRLYIRAR
jgi:flagellar motor protein MotB